MKKPQLRGFFISFTNYAAPYQCVPFQTKDEANGPVGVIAD
jgi:hypothetical protein